MRPCGRSDLGKPERDDALGRDDQLRRVGHREGHASRAYRDRVSFVEADTVVTAGTTRTKPNRWQYIGYCYLGVGCGNL